MNSIPNLRDIHSKSILVTGAAGLIGSAIMWQLSKLGVHKIIACDHMSEVKWRNLAPLKFADYIEAGDLLSWMKDGTVEDKLPPLAYVFHMGAKSATTSVDAAGLYTWNLDFSRHIHSWCTRRGIRLTYASSAATFGDKAVDHPDELGLLPTLMPTSMYGWFKHRFDMYLSNVGWGDTVGLRFFNVFGPNEYHKSQKSMVFRAHEEISKGRLEVFYEDELSRDFIYVKDAADAAIHAARHGTRGLVSVGTGEMTQWTALADMLCRRLAPGEQAHRVLTPTVIVPGYQQQTRADVSRLNKIGWEPKYTLAEAIEDCLSYTTKGKRLGEEPEEG